MKTMEDEVGMAGEEQVVQDAVKLQPLALQVINTQSHAKENGM